MNSEDSLVSAMQGSDAVFLVTNYWESGDPKVEISQGKRVVDAAIEAGVKQIIFSSLPNVSKITNGRLAYVFHSDSKAEIEEYIRSANVIGTFVLAGYYMSNYKEMLQKADDGTFSLAYPVNKDSEFPLFDTAQDMGESSVS